MIKEYTHKAHSDMLLNLSASGSRTGSLDKELTHYKVGRHYAGAEVCRRLKIGSVIPTALEKAGCPRTVRTSAKEDTIIAAVGR